MKARLDSWKTQVEDAFEETKRKYRVTRLRNVRLPRPDPIEMDKPLRHKTAPEVVVDLEMAKYCSEKGKTIETKLDTAYFQEETCQL